MSDLLKELYKDFNLEYLPNGSKGPAELKGFDTIRESLKNILFTDLGSRFFNRRFGNLLQALLFEPMNELTATSIQIMLSTELPKMETRVEISPFGVTVIPDYKNNTYIVTIMLKEKQTNQEYILNAALSKGY